VSRSVASVAQIKGQVGSGTGFLAAPGVIATNAHILKDELIARLAALFPATEGSEKGPYPVQLMYIDRSRDIALLRVECRLPPLPLAQDYQFQRGEDLTIIGNPSGMGGTVTLENAVNRGVLSTEVELFGQRWFQLAASLNPGNSGGPAIDSVGRVIGIVTLKSAAEEGQSYCIPIAALTTALDQVIDLPDEERSRLGRKHDAQCLFRVFTALGQTYLNVLGQRALAGMTQAEGAKEPMDESLPPPQTLDNATSLYEGVHKGYFAAFREFVESPETDPAIRHDLEELERSIEQFKSAAAQPVEDSGRSGLDYLSDQHQFDKLTRRLAHALDTDLEE
jgi:hypothetical protein